MATTVRFLFGLLTYNCRRDWLGGRALANTKTLEQALKDILTDDGKVSKWDAKAIRELIMADGRVSTEEKLFLEKALKDNVFDDEAFQMLNEMLLREEMKYRS
jgi:hypothetical protein